MATIGRQFAATESALQAWADHVRGKSAQSMSVEAWANLIEHGAWPANRNRGPSHPYQQIAAVFRATQFIAGAIASLPFNVSTANDELLESGPIIDLIDNPAPGVSGDDFWLETAGWLMLTGRVHWVFTQMRGNQPTEMLPVGAPQMTPEVDKTSGEVTSYTYRPAGSQGQRLTIQPEEQWRIDVPAFDTNQPHTGVGILDVVKRAINQVWKADSANENSLDNDVEPGGALQTDSSLTDEQRNQIRQQVNEKHAGAQNRRRFMLLEGGLKFERTQATFSEMEFSTLRRTSVEEICAAYGIDKAAIGFSPEGGRFEYVKSAKDSAWIDRILPLADWLAGHFDKGIVARFADDRSIAMRDAMKHARRLADPKQRACPGHLKARQQMTRRNRRLVSWFDSSNVPAVKETIASRVETAGQMVDRLKATPADAIELFDLGLPINDWQKTGWQKATEIQIGEPMPGENDEPGDQAEPDDSSEASWRQRADDPPTVEAPDEQPEKRQRLWAQWRASWDGIRKSFEKKYRGRVQKWRRAILKNLDRTLGRKALSEAHGEQLGVVWHEPDTGAKHERVFDLPVGAKDVIAEIMFDVVAAENDLLSVTGPLVRESVRLGGQQIMDEVAAITGAEEADQFNIRDEEAQAAIRRRRVQIKGQPRRVAERVRSDLAEGLEAGENIEQLGERVKKRMNVEGTRARTVAFQETSSAVEESRAVGKDQANVPMKSWLWSHKETGRPEHAATERATMDDPIPRDDDFQIVGTIHTAPHPRAVGVPEQDISCGCTSISRFPDDQVKSMEDAIEKILAFGVTTPGRLAQLDAREQTPQPSKEADHATSSA